MQKIVILNGAPKRNGNTASLVKAFSEGALESGNEVKEFYLNGLTIKGCLDCQGCARKERDAENPCVQKDDMAQIYPAVAGADVIVFASPIYWWTFSGTLKTAIDRLYALQQNSLSMDKKKTVLLMTAWGDDYDNPAEWYSLFEKWLGWENLGYVFGKGKEDEARALGKSIC